MGVSNLATNTSASQITKAQSENFPLVWHALVLQILTILGTIPYLNPQRAHMGFI